MEERTENDINRHDVGLASGLNATRVGVLANIVLVILKLTVGFIGRSQALIADGVHSVSDLFSDLVVYFGLKWGRKEADEDHPFGHGRIETLSSLIVGLILFMVGVGIAYNSLLAVYSHEPSTPTMAAVWVAAASILIKEALYWYTLAVGRRINSPVVIANAWHHRTDALSSVAVLIGVVAANINPAWHIADPIAALVVSYFIFRVAVSLITTAVKELVDTAPGEDVVVEIKRKAATVTGVHEIHDVRARQSGPHLLLELHVVVDKDITVLEGHGIAKKVKLLLMKEFKKVSNVTIHIDPNTQWHRKS